MRYTEARLTAAAMEMVASIDEDTVDFIRTTTAARPSPRYSRGHPEPAGQRHGRDRGRMATNMAPHNLGEVVAAVRHLLKHPDASLDSLMRYVPGPDLPPGDASWGSRGSGRPTRRARHLPHPGHHVYRAADPRRSGIVVTELPYGIGPEKVMTRIKTWSRQEAERHLRPEGRSPDRKRGLHW